MMRRYRLGALFSILLVLLLAVVFNLSAPVDRQPDQSIETTADSNSPVENPGLSVEIPAQQSGTVSTSTVKGTSKPVSSTPIPLAAFTLDFETSIGEWMSDYSKSIRESSPEDFDLKQRQADKLDADAAYWLYEYYKYCNDAPRTDWQMEHVLTRVEQRVEHAGGEDGNSRRLDRMQKTLDWYEQAYQLCSVLGTEIDTHAESLAWLETAADLDHVAAMRLYHSQARELLTGDDSSLAYQQPDLIHAFALNARKYARELMEIGHPQAYMLMARMYFVGDVFEQNFTRAYAYARAGYLVGIQGSKTDAQNWLNVISPNLSPAEIPQAEKMAQDLLNPK
jgi:hypothetical protein